MKLIYSIFFIGSCAIATVPAGAFEIPRPAEAKGFFCDFSQIAGDLDGDGSSDMVFVYGDSASGRVLQVYSVGKAKDLYVGVLGLKTRGRTQAGATIFSYRDLISWKDLDGDGITDLMVGGKIFTFQAGSNWPPKQ